MYLVQVALINWLLHELPDAYIQCTLNYKLWASAKGGANALVI
jgi:hypothetical protein